MSRVDVEALRAEVIAIRAENESLKVALATAQTDAFDAAEDRRARDGAVAELVEAGKVAVLNMRTVLRVDDVELGSIRLLTKAANSIESALAALAACKGETT